MIKSNFDNLSSSKILEKVAEIKKTTEVSSENVKDEIKVMNQAIERVNNDSEIVRQLCKTIEKEYENEQIEKHKNKKKELPFLALMEINMEIKRRKEHGISQPYYRDRAFVDHILKTYDVDMWA